MRLESSRSAPPEQVTSESEFFQRVKKRTLGSVAWERVEPSNESGFPDTYFVVRRRGKPGPEGTVEFKFSAGAGCPSLASDMVRGTQKSALLEYAAAGGTRRYFLVCNGQGMVWLYNTADAARAVRTGELCATALAALEEPSFCAWLISCLSAES